MSVRQQIYKLRDGESRELRLTFAREFSSCIKRLNFQSSIFGLARAFWKFTDVRIVNRDQLVSMVTSNKIATIPNLGF